MKPLSNQALRLLEGLSQEGEEKVRSFLLQDYAGLPTSSDAEEKARRYFAQTSTISAAVMADPGSFVVTELLYDSENHSKINSIIDNYFWESMAGKAVKARLDAIIEKLSTIIDSYLQKQDSVNILNLGSGPGRDIINILSAHPESSRIRAICIDKNETALQEGRSRAQKEGVDHLIQFVNGNFLKRGTVAQSDFDIVLLIGILCPLDAKTCVTLLRLIKRFLKKQGCVVASSASKTMLAKDPFTCYVMKKMGSWRLNFKDKKEMQKIFEGAGYIWQGYFTDEYNFHIMGIGKPQRQRLKTPT